MIQRIIEQRRKDLGGGFEVGRVLPVRGQRMVGPFIFFDHIGPTTFPPGIPEEIDVRPHPHIGLSTVTYLFAGEMMHRDSVGSEQPIRPGEVNWMTAGRGITHSERFEQARAHGGPMHGIQSWVALPDADEETDPVFDHYPSEVLPELVDGGLRARLVAGTAWGLASPVRTHSPLFYLHCELQPGTRVELPDEHPEGRLRGHRRDRSRRPTPRGRHHAGVRARAGRAGRFGRPRPGHVVGRRSGGPTLHRLELRVLFQGADRAGQGGLAGRADEAPRPGRQGLDSAPGGPRTDPTRGHVLTYNRPCSNQPVGEAGQTRCRRRKRP